MESLGPFYFLWIDRFFSWFFVFSHAHKNTVMEVKLNLNGNWLLTASRDHLCKLFDIRNLKEELQVFRGHKKEATGQWHKMLPIWLLPGAFWDPNHFVFSCDSSGGLASGSWRSFCQWRVWWLFVILACWVCTTLFLNVARSWIYLGPNSVRHQLYLSQTTSGPYIPSYIKK